MADAPGRRRDFWQAPRGRARAPLGCTRCSASTSRCRAQLCVHIVGGMDCLAGHVSPALWRDAVLGQDNARPCFRKHGWSARHSWYPVAVVPMSGTGRPVADTMGWVAPVMSRRRTPSLFRMSSCAATIENALVKMALKSARSISLAVSASGTHGRIKGASRSGAAHQRVLAAAVAPSGASRQSVSRGLSVTRFRITIPLSCSAQPITQIDTTRSPRHRARVPPVRGGSSSSSARGTRRWRASANPCRRGGGTSPRIHRLRAWARAASREA